jgi:hypothetical protein
VYVAFGDDVVRKTSFWIYDITATDPTAAMRNVSRSEILTIAFFVLMFS